MMASDPLPSSSSDLIFATTESSTESQTTTFTSVGGVISSIISPFLSIVAFVSFNKSKEKENPKTPGDRKTELKEQLSFLTYFSFVLSSANLAMTFPVPLNKNIWGDRLSFSVYGVSLLGNFVSPVASMINARVGAIVDIGTSVTKLLIGIPADLFDQATFSKYLQDVLIAIGAATNDVGVVIKGSDGVGAVVRTAGLSMKTAGSLVLLLRTIENIINNSVDGDDNVIRVQLAS